MTCPIQPYFNSTLAQTTLPVLGPQNSVTELFHNQVTAPSFEPQPLKEHEYTCSNDQMSLVYPQIQALLDEMEGTCTDDMCPVNNMADKMPMLIPLNPEPKLDNSSRI